MASSAYPAQAEAAVPIDPEAAAAVAIDPEAEAAAAKNCEDIHQAAKEGNVGAVRHFLRVDPESLERKSQDLLSRTPLHLAALDGHVEVVVLLLKSGASVEVTDDFRRTPLHLAALDGHVEVVVLLLKSGASVEVTDDFRWTPLHFAAGEDHAAVVEQLISAGATVDAANNDGWTALHYAAHKGHAAVVELLISAGAKVDAARDNGRTALHRAAEKGDAAVVELLISAGVKVDAAGNDGWTPLHFAAGEDHAAVVEQLISAGATVDAANNDGQTPYDRAKEKGHRQVMGLLRPVFVALLSGRSCRCNSSPERTVLELKEEAEKKLDVNIKRIIGQNHEPLDESKTLAEAHVEPGNPLTAVIAAPEAENEEGLPETEAEPLDEAQGLKDPRSFIDFLTSADICLVRLEFLLELHQDGLAMPRRQEAETMRTKNGATALVTLEEYQRLLVNDNTGHISIRAGPKHQLVTVHFRSLSHMWESMQHPDPWRYQLGVVTELYQNLQDVVWVFVDFISLYQYKRNDSQDSSFRKALDRMHMLYSHEMVQVDILEDLTAEKMKVDGTLFVYDPTEDAMNWVPITSLKLNPTPHALRGWCQAEKEWARLRMMLTAMGIPTPPEIFRQRMGR